MKSDLVDIEMECMHRTERALLAHTGDSEAAVWLPLSQVEVEPSGDRGKTAVVTMPEWLAIENGLI